MPKKKDRAKASTASGEEATPQTIVKSAIDDDERVETIVFNDPTARKPASRPKPRVASGDNTEQRDGEEDEDMDEFFRRARQEVLSLGGRHLDKRKKRQFEQERLQALGAKAPKSQRMPLPMLKGLRTAAKRRDLKRLDIDRAAGMASHKDKKAKDDKKKKRGPRGIDDRRISKGVLRVNKRL